jgi:hypothetical protein
MPDDSEGASLEDIQSPEAEKGEERSLSARSESQQQPDAWAKSFAWLRTRWRKFISPGTAIRRFAMSLFAASVARISQQLLKLEGPTQPRNVLRKAPLIDSPPAIDSRSMAQLRPSNDLFDLSTEFPPYQRTPASVAPQPPKQVDSSVSSEKKDPPQPPAPGPVETRPVLPQRNRSREASLPPDGPVTPLSPGRPVPPRTNSLQAGSRATSLSGRLSH